MSLLEPLAVHTEDLDEPAEDAVHAVARAADLWGARWDRAHGQHRGTLYLPVTAGLRRGVVRGRLEVAGEGGGSRVTFTAESSEYRVQGHAVGILVISAFGALLLMLWPFFPESEKLRQVAPLGALLALGGWFLVVSRLQTSGIEDFFTLVREVDWREPVDEGLLGSSAGED